MPMGRARVLLVPSSSGIWVQSLQTPALKFVFTCKLKPVDGEGHETVMLELERMIESGGDDGAVKEKETKPFTSGGGRPGRPFSTAACAVKSMTVDLPIEPFVDAISKVAPSAC